MEIHYPSEHKWLEVISDNPLGELGKNNRARLRSTLNVIDTTTIEYSILPLTQEILDWFIPLYEQQISEKNNPKVHDIAAKTIYKVSKYKYFILVLRENGMPIGGTIFSKRKNLISIAYRIYPANWSTHNLQASPSLFTEYAMNMYGHTEGFTLLSHGKDRNPYGRNASIGLALFKLSVGCNVYLPSDYEVNTLDLATVEEDILVFEMPKNGETRITKGYLCVTDDSLLKYENVTKYPERISIEIIKRT